MWKDVDVFVLPSSYNEGIPKVILEAYAAKCVIVCSKRKCMNEIISNNLNGLLIPKPYDKNLYHVLEDLIPNVVRRQEIVNSCTNLSKMDVKQVVKVHFDALLSVA